MRCNLSGVRLAWGLRPSTLRLEGRHGDRHLSRLVLSCERPSGPKEISNNGKKRSHGQRVPRSQGS
jgi:hypothetical protein